MGLIMAKSKQPRYVRIEGKVFQLHEDTTEERLRKEKAAYESEGTSFVIINPNHAQYKEINSVNHSEIGFF